MSHQRVLFWVVLMMAAIGLVDSQDGEGRAVEQALDLHLLAGLAASFLSFRWYRSDSDARGFPRSRWLSAAVAAFAFCAIPYYLLRSRAAGERGWALMAYAGYLGTIAFAVWVGMAIHIGLS